MNYFMNSKLGEYCYHQNKQPSDMSEVYVYICINFQHFQHFHYPSPYQKNYWRFFCDYGWFTQCHIEIEWLFRA